MKQNKRRRPTKLTGLLVIVILIGLISFINQRTDFLAPAQYYLASLMPSDEHGSNAKSLLVVALEDDQVFASKNENARRLPASLSKLFVIEYALTQVDLWDEVYVEQRIFDQVKSGSTVGWLYTRDYYVHDLIAAMLVPSANDATYALANHVGKVSENSTVEENIANFTKNLKTFLEQNGYTNTKINDPSGYDSDAYTTAQDLKKVTTNLLEHDWFRDIVSKHSYTARVDEEITQTWINTNQYLNTESEYYYENVAGIKTGSLDNEYNLIILYQKDNKEFLIINLGSMSDLARYRDVNQIISAIDEAY